jgi:hypothetical protein
MTDKQYLAEKTGVSVSGLDKYKVELGTTRRWYDVFVTNTYHRKTFRITLVCGDVAEGIPTCTPVLAFDEQVRFWFWGSDGNFYCIPFGELKAVGGPL